MTRLHIFACVAIALGFAWASPAPAEPTVTIHDVSDHVPGPLNLDEHDRMWMPVNKAEKDKGACGEVAAASEPTWCFPPFRSVCGSTAACR